MHQATSAAGHQTGRGWFNGEALDYAQFVVLKNVWFNVDQKARLLIATGQRAKFPMASVDGEFCGYEATPFFDGLEIRFNPKTMTHFSDMQGSAISWAESVTVCAHRVYARGAVRYLADEADRLPVIGGASSALH